MTEALRLPKRTRTLETHETLCRLLVTAEGAISVHRCETVASTRRLEERLTKQIYAAIQKARIRPAAQGGTPVAVTMAVRVVVACDGDGCQAAVLANSGVYSDRLGEHYVEAQEIVQGAGTWYDRQLTTAHCAAAAGREPSCSDRSVYESQALLHVDAIGAPLELLDHGDWEDGYAVLGELESLLEDTRFTPTFDATGNPVPGWALVTAFHSVDSEVVERPLCFDRDPPFSKIKMKTCFSAQEYEQARAASGRRRRTMLSYLDSIDNSMLYMFP
ncbi:MAG: hypothetical protein AAF184_24495 [Pseudomonadota bacterium]